MIPETPNKQMNDISYKQDSVNLWTCIFIKNNTQSYRCWNWGHDPTKTLKVRFGPSPLPVCVCRLQDRWLFMYSKRFIWMSSRLYKLIISAVCQHTGANLSAAHNYCIQKIWQEIKFGGWWFFVEITKFISPIAKSLILLHDVTLESLNLFRQSDALLISPNIFPAIFSAYTVAGF